MEGRNNILFFNDVQTTLQQRMNKPLSFCSIVNSFRGFFLPNTAGQLVERGILISKVNGWSVFDYRQKNKKFLPSQPHIDQ
jgi:hypothetical protein